MQSRHQRTLWWTNLCLWCTHNIKGLYSKQICVFDVPMTLKDFMANNIQEICAFDATTVSKDFMANIFVPSKHPWHQMIYGKQIKSQTYRCLWHDHGIKGFYDEQIHAFDATITSKNFMANKFDGELIHAFNVTTTSKNFMAIKSVHLMAHDIKRLYGEQIHTFDSPTISKVFMTNNIQEICAFDATMASKDFIANKSKWQTYLCL